MLSPFFLVNCTFIGLDNFAVLNVAALEQRRIFMIAALSGDIMMFERVREIY